MADWAVENMDDIRELEPVGESPMRPVRHHFGITAFGVNAWTAKAAGDRVINEHEEDPGSEELYIVTRGRATFELDGERRDAPAGTFVFAQPNVKRTAFAEEAGTTVVAVGGTAGKPYTPVGWELWYPLRKRYEAGEHEAVAAELREVVAEAPHYALLFYNLACLESLTGRGADAIPHLQKAIELSEQFREYARQDSDLDAVRDDPAFVELMATAD
jgi:mannose-6-phosphate isomerase-like protein (cupin superfamily)